MSDATLGKTKSNIVKPLKSLIRKPWFKEIKNWLYVIPALVLVSVFVIYPMIKVVRMSFYQNYNYIREEGTGFGLKAYKYVLDDYSFRNAVKNTLIILCIGLPISMILAVAISALINSRTKSYALFQSIFFIPYVTSTLAVGVIFRTMFHSQYGYINKIIELFGGTAHNWLGDPKYAIWVVLIFYIWNGLAFKIVVLLAGFKRIDEQVYKAAKIDGSTPWRTFRKITLPLLSPTLWMLLIVSVIYAFKMYTEIYALFNGTAGPANSAMTMVYYIYEMFYTRHQIHYASAASVLLFLIILVVTIIQKAVAKRFTHY